MATCDPNIQQKNPNRAFIRARNKKSKYIFIGCELLMTAGVGIY